jgi:hypothetical protein
MSKTKYITEKNYRIPQPEFTPGFSPNVTSVLFVSSAIGWAAVVLPGSEVNIFDSANYEPKTKQIVIVDQTPRFVEKNKSNDSTAIPFSEHASLVSSALGLGKSDIARILGISRPTLYSWIKGDSEPRENDHPERLRTLGELTVEICKQSKRPLYHRFVEDPLSNQTSSILNLLLAKEWDLDQLRQLLAQARELTSERDQRLGHVTPIRISQSKQESNLLDNSIALNLE